MYTYLIPQTNLFQQLKDFFFKSEDATDNDKPEGEKRPSWVNEILDALKPKEQELEPEEIPLPPVPETVEEEEEEEQPQKPSKLKKIYDFLM